MRKFLQFALILLLAAPAFASQTWFVRSDGGTRYSSNVTTGQCNGQYDASYASTGGSGVNQNCAFNDVRYLWQDGIVAIYGSSTFPAWGWIGAGGDTYVIRNGPWRIGWPNASGSYTGSSYFGLAGNPYASGAPPPPSGTSGAHTRILGACAYGTYTCNPVNTYPYTSNNLTQLFGGFGTETVINLSGAQYIDIEGLEITTHNGACSIEGTPKYPRGCVTSAPIDDYGSSGFTTTNTTSNITFQDVYIHGFNKTGLAGPIGGPITMTRVFVGFNTFAGWNFDDGSDTPDAAGSSITSSYVWMEGNGCQEQYPIVNTQFSAMACWDLDSNGFGDSWSGQDTELDSFICDHCTIIYNTKDGDIGPHVSIAYEKETNSFWYANMGQQQKQGHTVGSTAIFQNNLIVGNCARMSQQVPGAVQNFNQSTGLGGSYLGDYCRAQGDVFAPVENAGSSFLFAGNTLVAYSATIFDLECPTSTCGTTTFTFEDNIFLGWTPPFGYLGWMSGEAPGLYYPEDSSITTTASYNVEYGIRNGDTCGTNHIVCSDPLLTNEPAQSWPTPVETALDVFNPFNTGNSFEQTSSSPSKYAGTAIGGLTTDYYGSAYNSPPSMGGVEYGSGPASYTLTVSTGVYMGPGITVK
jgi:hypothetical protein